jgi:SET domain-containing protein
MNPEPTCRLTPDAEVRGSPIEGTGLFAVRPITHGTLIARLGGTSVTTTELHALFDRSDHYIDTIGVDEDQHLILPEGNPIHHGNHSCDPNLWWDGPFDLVARRDIEADEELTSDYATSTVDTAFSLDCRCGAENCRGTISAADSWEYALDRVYAGHVVPVVQQAIDARRSTGQ